jgi:nucleoside-diphosphate-sugar epimerase
MRIVITGNMGYVGPALTAHLRQAFPGVELVGIDVGFFGHCLTGAACLPESRVDVQYIADVRTLDPKLLEGADAVVQLAALSNDPMGKTYEALTDEINCKAATRITEMAKQVGVRSVVFASSCSVYGFAEDAITEDSKLNPLTAYAHSKINTEIAIRDLATDDFKITCLRFPTACGMSDRLRLDLVLNDFVASAVSSGRIDILSDGTPWRPLIDIKDMSRGMEWAIRRDASCGGPFLSINVGTNDANYQVRDLAHAVQKQMPSVEVKINQDAQPDKRSYRVDFSRYREIAPDFLPQITLEQSIRELREGLEGMNFADQEFRTSQFIRLKVLSGLRERGLLNDTLNWARE